jgi:hypothetical protein
LAAVALRSDGLVVVVDLAFSRSSRLRALSALASVVWLRSRWNCGEVVADGLRSVVALPALSLVQADEPER